MAPVPNLHPVWSGASSNLLGYRKVYVHLLSLFKPDMWTIFDCVDTAFGHVSGKLMELGSSVGKVITGG